MNDFPRLHDEPESELERSLLSAGRSYAASAGTRAKTLAALGVVGAAASATTAAATATKAGALKWLAGAGLIAAVTVPAVHYLRKAAPQAEAPRPMPAANTTKPATQAAVTSKPPPMPKSPDPTVNDAPAPSTAATAPAPLTAAKPVTGAQGLTAELAALDTARAALTAGDANGALVNLDAYARNFPHAKLSLEAEVLRIDALAKSGQTAAAQKRAQAFIKRHPDSVLASRVRAYAGQ